MSHSDAVVACERSDACLYRWRQVVEDRDLLRSTVRTCIMQKRVSFAFFKQWYWDCFDEDVQVCSLYTQLCAFR